LSGGRETRQTGEEKEGCPRFLNTRLKRKTYLVDDSSPLVLFQPSLHLGKSVKDSLGLFHLFLFVSVKFQCCSKDLPSLVKSSALLLKLAPFYPDSWSRSYSHPTFIDGAGSVQLLVPFLELDVRLPCFIIWFPLHPALKDLSDSRKVLEELL